MDISAIILAAGESSRLGRAKQLLPYKGKSLLQNSIDKLLEVGISSPMIILGAREQEIRAHITQYYPNLPILFNAEWKTGMSSTLKKGLSHIPSQTQALLLCLSDQPLVPAQHLANMLSLVKKHDQLVASSYNDRLGVPAVFPSRYFEELQSLKGKQGARSLLHRYHDQVLALPCPQAAYDVDTEEDYRRIVEMN